MTEKRFWALIEAAWQAVGGKVKDRQKLVVGRMSEAKLEALLESLGEVIPTLSDLLDNLNAPELMEFDRILERKLYAIDRADVHEHAGGSDDGFLYARGFIVAAGHTYYEAVNADPAAAIMDLECEEMCYLSCHLFEEKFGEMPASGISRESCANKAGWPDL